MLVVNLIDVEIRAALLASLRMSLVIGSMCSPYTTSSTGLLRLLLLSQHSTNQEFAAALPHQRLDERLRVNARADTLSSEPADQRPVVAGVDAASGSCDALPDAQPGPEGLAGHASGLFHGLQREQA